MLRRLPSLGLLLLFVAGVTQAVPNLRPTLEDSLLQANSRGHARLKQDQAPMATQRPVEPSKAPLATPRVGSGSSTSSTTTSTTTTATEDRVAPLEHTPDQSSVGEDFKTYDKLKAWISTHGENPEIKKLDDKKREELAKIIKKDKATAPPPGDEKAVVKQGDAAITDLGGQVATTMKSWFQNTKVLDLDLFDTFFKTTVGSKPPGDLVASMFPHQSSSSSSTSSVSRFAETEAETQPESPSTAPPPSTVRCRWLQQGPFVAISDPYVKTSHGADSKDPRLYSRDSHGLGMFDYCVQKSDVDCTTDETETLMPPEPHMSKVEVNVRLSCIDEADGSRAAPPQGCSPKIHATAYYQGQSSADAYDFDACAAWLTGAYSVITLGFGDARARSIECRSTHEVAFSVNNNPVFTKACSTRSGNSLTREDHWQLEASAGVEHSQTDGSSGSIGVGAQFGSKTVSQESNGQATCTVMGDRGKTIEGTSLHAKLVTGGHASLHGVSRGAGISLSKSSALYVAWAGEASESCGDLLGASDVYYASWEGSSHASDMQRSYTSWAQNIVNTQN